MFNATPNNPPSTCLMAVTIAIGLFLSAGCATPQSADQAPVAPKGFAFWPPFPAEPRIQYITAYRFSTDIEAPASNLEKLVLGDEVVRESLPINKPYGVEMRDGRIYVCDIRSAGVLVLDLRKKETRLMGVSGFNTLVRPTDIAIAPDGMIYVADPGAQAVLVFDANERYLTKFGHADLNPVSLAVHNQELFVCDFEAKQVVVLDRGNGEIKRKLGKKGSEDGQFSGPLGIDTDKAGNVYVSDVLKGRVQKFDTEGKVSLAFGQIGDNIGSFVRPKHVAVDDTGKIFVVDAAFQNVQVFDNEGNILTFFGSAGPHPGAMFLPAGICIQKGDLDLFEEYIHPAFKAEQLLIVTNQFGLNKVAIYAMGQLRPGRTAQDIVKDTVEMDIGVADPDKKTDRSLFESIDISAGEPGVAPETTPAPGTTPETPSTPEPAPPPQP